MKSGGQRLCAYLRACIGGAPAHLLPRDRVRANLLKVSVQNAVAASGDRRLLPACAATGDGALGEFLLPSAVVLG